MRFECGGLGDERKIHYLLDGAGGEHGEAGRADGHHVAVIAEDGQRLGGQGRAAM